MGGGYKSILKNKGNFDFDLAEDSKRKESIDQAKYLELINNTTDKSPYPVLTFEVRDDKKTLIKTELYKESTYTIQNASGTSYKEWGHSPSLLDTFDEGTYDKIGEGENIPINQSTYIYAFLNTGRRKVNVNIKYEFEIADNVYASDENFARLEKSLITHNSKEGESISTRTYDAYSQQRDKRLKMLDQAGWDKNSKGYEKKPEIFYTSDKITQIKKTDGNILDDGSTNYTAIFRYNRKTYQFKFVDDTGRTVSKERLGLSTLDFKFRDKVTINPITLDGGRLFDYWQVTRKVDRKFSTSIFESTQYDLNEDAISDDGIITFKAVADTSTDKRKLVLKYYRETSTTDVYEQLHSKILVHGVDGYSFINGGKINDLNGIIKRFKQGAVDKTFENMPNLINELTAVEYENIDDVTYETNDLMIFQVKYKRSRNIIKFHESESGEGVLSGEEFSRKFDKEVQVKYDDKISDVLQGKNQPGTTHTFTDATDEIGKITLLGWKPVNPIYNEYCVNGYFDLDTYTNKDNVDNKKIIDLYPVWHQEQKLYVKAYLSDPKAGDKTVNGNADLKYRLTYNFIQTIEKEYNSVYEFNNNVLKTKLQEKIKSELGKDPAESVLWNNLTRVFNFEAINNDVYDSTQITISKTQKNKFEVFIKRYTSKIKFKLNYNYTENGVADNVAQLAENGGVSDYEKKGLGELDFVIQDYEEYSKEVEVTDRGLHPINLKEEIEKIKTPSQLLGDSPVYEADKYTAKVKDTMVESGEVSNLVSGDINYERGTEIIVDYKPKEFKIKYEKGTAASLPSDAPKKARYLHKITLNLPTGKPGDKFLGWRYLDGGVKKEISPALIKYIKDSDENIISAEYIMTGRDITLIPIFGQAIYTKVHVLVRTQGTDGKYTTHNHNSYIQGPEYELGADGERDYYFKKGETDPSKKADITPFTRPDYISGIDYSYLYLENPEQDMGNIGEIKETGGKYLLSIKQEYKGFDIEVVVTFNRYRVSVNFDLRNEHKRSGIEVKGMPSPTTVYVGGKLSSNEEYSPQGLDVTVGGVKYPTFFRGYSELDTESAEATNPTNISFDKEEYKRFGATVTFYARWHAVQGVPIYAGMQFETVAGGSYEHVVDDIALDGEYKLPFDGQLGSKVIPNEYRSAIARKLSDVIKRPYVSEANQITYDGNGDDEFDLRLDKNIFTYRMKRKRVTVQFSMPTGSSPSSIAEQTVIFGAKMTPIPTSVTYRQSGWDSETFASLKHFSEQGINYIENYAEDAPKFDHINHVFDRDEDFAQPTKILYPIWNRAQKVPIMLRVYGQKTSGPGLDNTAEGMQESYIAGIRKTDGEQIKPSELVEFIRSKMNTTIYNSNDIQFKRNGVDLAINSPIDVSVPNIGLDVILIRNIRTVTLNTDATVKIDKLKGHQSVSNNNKIISYRHGYIFDGNEEPYVDDTTDDAFVGWKNGSTRYLFNNSNQVTANVILTLETRWRYSYVNIDVDGLTATNLRYQSDGIDGALSGSTIRLKIYEQKFPYTLKNLVYSGLLYSNKIQDYAEQNGYTSNSTINKSGETYHTKVKYGVKPGATVKIGLNGITATSLRYDHDGIVAYASGNNITVNIPFRKFATNVYELQDLKYSGAMYTSQISDYVNQTGYTGNIRITESGKTYDVQVKYQKKPDAKVEINLQGIRGDNLRYSADGITGYRNYDTINISVPYKKFATSPYTLKPLVSDNNNDLYLDSTHKGITLNGYASHVINEEGKQYRIWAHYTDKSKDRYIGYYPQSRYYPSGEPKVSGDGDETFSKYVKYSTIYTTTVYYKGEKYERVNISGQYRYYKYEYVHLDEFPTNNAQKWTKKTLEVSVLNAEDGSNNYASSYLKEYLDKVVKVKMRVALVEMPKISGRDVIGFDDTVGWYNNNVPRIKMKYNGITDYGTLLYEHYGSLRGINSYQKGDSQISNVYQFTRLATACADGNSMWVLYPDGHFSWWTPRQLLGIRPAVRVN